MPTTYLAPTLQDQGYTGATGTTPYKPATTQQVDALQGLYNNSPVANAPQVVSYTATVININFDGTKNNGDFPAPGESSTNISQLSKLQAQVNGKANTIYMPGVGAQTVPAGTLDANGNPAPGSYPSNWDSIPFNAGDVANGIVKDAYKELTDRVTTILAEDPNAEISLNLSGFSRGGAEAVAFANLVNERGIPGFYEAGQVPIDSMVLFDPVSQTNGQLNTAWPSNVKSSFVMVAENEGRAIMAAMPVGGDATVVLVPGAHADVGGSFNPDGVSAVTLKMAWDFQEQCGVPIAEIPDSLAPNWAHMNVHNSGLDNYGNTVWSFNENYRAYEGAGLGAPSVVDVVRKGAHYAANPDNVAAGDALDYKVPVDPSKPDGEQLIVRESTDRNGKAVVSVMDVDGKTLLTSMHGEALTRDPQTGQFTVTNVETGTSTNYDLQHSLSYSFSTHLEGQGSNLTPAQQDALTAQLDKLNIGGEGDLSFYTFPSGGTFIVNADGDMVGEINRNVSTGEVTLNATGIDDKGNAVQVSNHIGEGGTVVSSDTKTQEQATALFNSLMAANNWDNLSDVGKLSALVSLYNASDKLGEAFGATGDNLPGDLGAAAGWLQLAQGIESGDNLVIANGLNTVSGGAVDAAINGAVGSEGVPYLSAILAARNFSENPEGAVGAMLGMYVGTAIGGPFGGAIGGMIGGSLLGDDDPPPPVGVVHFEWDTHGQIQPVVEINQSGAGGYAQGVAQQLQGVLESVVHAINAQNPSRADDVALNPFLIPKVYADSSGTWLEVKQANGSTVREAITKDTGTRLVEILHDNGGLAPVLQVQTLQAQYQETQAEIAALQAQVSVAENLLPRTVSDEGSVGNQPITTVQPRYTMAGSGDGEYAVLDGDNAADVAVYEQAQAALRDAQAQQQRVLTAGAGGGGQALKGDAAVSGDGLSQSFGALVVHINQNPGVRQSLQALGETLTRTTEILKNTDSDAFLEKTEWLSATDAQRNLQGLLVLDQNQNGIIETRDILNWGGNTAQNGDQQRNNVQWLDANGDMQLTASDPVFAAIKVWVDLNQDGQMQTAENESLAALGVKSVNFATSDITYVDGRTDEVTVTSLKSDALGVQARVIDEGVLQGTEQLDGGVDYLLYASNSNELAGEAAHTHGGNVATTGSVNKLHAVTNSEAAVSLKSTTNKTVLTEGTQTKTSATGDDGRLNTDGRKGGRVLIGDQARTQSQGTVTQVQSAGASQANAFVQLQRQSATVNAANTTNAAANAAVGRAVVFVPSTAWGIGNLDDMEDGAQTSSGFTRTVTANMVQSAGSGLFGVSNALSGLAGVAVGMTAAQWPVVASARDAQEGGLAEQSGQAAQPTTAVLPAGQGYRVSTASGATVGTAATPEATLGATPSTTMHRVNASELTSSGLTSVSPSVGDVGVSTPVVVAAWTSLPSLTLGSSVSTTPSVSTSPALYTTVNSTPGSYSTAAVTEVNAATTAWVNATPATVVVPISYLAPAVVGETAQVAEDARVYFAAQDLLANDSFKDSNGQLAPHDALRLVAVGNAVGGSAELNANGDVVFTPQANFNGAASFDYTVSNGHGGLGVGSVNLEITAVNDAPVTVDEQLTGWEDQTLLIDTANLLANDTDVDGAAGRLRVASLGPSKHGTASLQTVYTTDAQGVVHAQTNVLFTPESDFNGEATVRYTVQDSEGATSEATLHINVGAVNDKPVATGEVVEVLEDVQQIFSVADLLANEVDADTPYGDVLRLISVQDVTHGTVALNANGEVVFTPEVNYNGEASFSYTVQDSAGAQSTASVTLHLEAVNDAPVALGEQIEAMEDQAITLLAQDLLVNDWDVEASAQASADGQQLRIGAINAVEHGRATLLANGDVSFTPDADYQGAARLTYTVIDGAGGEGQASATIRLAGVNDAPVATGEMVDGQEDVQQMFRAADLLANEVDADTPYGDVVALISVQDARHGTVALNANGEVVFTPEVNYNGDASFSYTVQDSAGAQSTASVRMTLTTVNDAPTVVSEVVTSQEDEGLVFDEVVLLANDSDVDGAPSDLHITAVQALAGAEVALGSDGKITFTPHSNFNGAASFEYTVSDAQGASSEAQVTVNVAEVNDAPFGADDALSDQQEDTNLTIASAALLANDLDVDLSTTSTEVLRIGSVVALQGKTHGTVSLNAQGDVVYVPDENYVGTVIFGYTTVDHAGVSTGVNQVSLNLLNVNDAPTTRADQEKAQEDGSAVFNPNNWLLNDFDVDASLTGDTVEFSGIMGTTGGTAVVQSDGQVLFTPTADFAGTATITYSVTDGQGGTGTGTVAVQVANVNDAPLAVDETLSTNEDVVQHISVASLLANDGDIDNPHSDLSVSAVRDATHGSVSWVGGEIVFTPTLDYNGDASFSYTISDGAGGTSQATATLHITEVNDAPSLTGESFAGLEDQVISFTTTSLLANDSDVDSPHSALSISAVQAIAGGSVALVDGDVVFTPTLNYNGAASFSYTVSDGQGGLSQAVVDVNLAPVADAPIVNNETYSGKANQILRFTADQLRANDLDPDQPYSLKITSVQHATNGTVGYDGTNVTFTPDFGITYGSFQYTVTNSSGLQSTGTTSLTFTNPNLNPVVVDDTFNGFEDVEFAISKDQLLMNDSDDSGVGNLRIGSVDSASHGVVALDANGNVTFNASPNYYGEASFRYQVVDAEGGSTWGKAYLNVQSVNDAPVLEDTWLGFPVGSTGTFYRNGVERPSSINYFDAIDANGNPVDDVYRQSGYIVAYDPDGDSSKMTLSISSAPAHGFLVVNQYVSYEAPAGIRDRELVDFLINKKFAMQYASNSIDTYTGLDTFKVRITDEGGAMTDLTFNPMHIGTRTLAPIALDLNHDGVQLVSADESKISMDMNESGVSQKIGWVAPEDGVLVYDENQNVLIDQINEVSFTSYVAGAQTDIEGLAGLDTNHDGEISGLDANFDRFGVFQDKDNNGLQGQSELNTLEQMGIASISLTRSGDTQLDHDQVVFGTSVVTHTDGSTSVATDVMFTPAQLVGSGSAEKDEKVTFSVARTHANDATDIMAASTVLTDEAGHATPPAVVTATAIDSTSNRVSAPAAQAVETNASSSMVAVETTHAAPLVVEASAADAQTAEIIRQALLFN